MSRHHLEENDFQAFLDNKATQSRDIEDHLDSCTSCRKILEYYKVLYDALGKEPHFKLPKHFARKVSIMAMGKSKILDAPFRMESILIGAVAMVALGTSIFFIDFSVFTQSFSQTGLGVKNLNNLLVGPAKNFLEGLNGSIILLVFAGLAILSMAGIDRLIRSLKEPKIQS